MFSFFGFPFFFFVVVIFFTVLMVKKNVYIKKFYFYKIILSINFLDSILMVSLNINNQKHL